MMLVTGGSGQLGTAFRRILPTAAFPDRGALDLARPQQLLRTLAKIAPRGIINCAAYNAVDRAEQDEDLATVVNGEAVGLLAGYAAEAGIPFVTFSTDYVFDGSATKPYVESDTPNPLNAYGRSKVHGERLATEAGGLVIRTSWVLSGTHGNFVATMLRLAAAGEEIRVVEDQIGCPTFVDDLAPATLQALDRRATGIVHLTNEGSTSWFGLARAALGHAGFAPDRVTPISSADYLTTAARPAYSVLGSKRRADLGIDPLPAWGDSLAGAVRSLTGPPSATN